LKFFNKKSNAKHFDEWISRYQGTLYKHALWMTGHREIALDMTQETFFQAWQAMDSLQNREKVLPWLLTIQRRAIYREQRFQYRHAETVAHLNSLDFETVQADAFTLLEIYSALEMLSPKLRETFLLYNLHGFSYEEISTQLEIPMGTVMSRISRARDALQVQQRAGESKVVKLIDVKRGIKNEG
jgi:RNA polymerase sigma-70 factor (ECF subfamily)